MGTLRVRLHSWSFVGQAGFVSMKAAASRRRRTQSTASYIVVLARAAWYGAVQEAHMEAHLYALAMEEGSGALSLDVQMQHVAKAVVTAA